MIDPDLETAVASEVDQLLALLRELKKLRGEEKMDADFLLAFVCELFKVPDDPDDMRGPVIALTADLLGRLI